MHLLFCRYETSIARLLGCLLLAGTTLLVGCSDDVDEVREIQAKRQQRMQSQSQQDHLGESFELLSRIVDLNADKAERQIAYHLNQWMAQRDRGPSAAAPKLLKTISDILPTEQVLPSVEREQVAPSDINHLRDCYLFRQVVRWVNTELRDDPLLTDWMDQQEQKLGDELGDQLRTAARLFEWTIRNIAFEPLIEPIPAPPGLELPLGMRFQGAGYRQSDYQTLWRGTGDAWQRAGVFTQLCQQASIRSAVLAIQSTETGELTPWCVGVLIGDEVYLFEPELGIHIPGPGQVGIATLAQARSDDAVMRRLSVTGFFDYPLTKADVQQNIALLNLMPAAISPRMKTLESGLTGDRRMRVYVDADEVAAQMDEATGIGGVRLWKVPLLAEVYRDRLEKHAERDPRFNFWYMSRWAIMDGGNEMARMLSRGRWRHLTGQFDDQEDGAVQGARKLYISQRAPEYEIADLDIDVELQKMYGIRRELRTSTEVYNQQVQQMQVLMRLGKRTATYWLSLVQYDDGRIETANSWLKKRVLNKEQLSHWEPAARYNLARTMERLDQSDEAIELYKTVGSPQEHGNRIRARLLAKQEVAE